MPSLVYFLIYCFNVYYQHKITKNIWDIMNKKYVRKDTWTHKYSLRNFRKFKMTKDRDVSSRNPRFTCFTNFAHEDVKLAEPFVVGYLIEIL